MSNPNAPELTINAAKGTAIDDHTGARGGAGNGGDWKTTYTFRVPKSLTPGNTASVAVGISATDVQPSQPIGFQISVFGPGFAQWYQLHYPTTSRGGTTFKIPIPADEKGAQSLTLTVGVLSAHVTYTYKPV